MGEIAVISDIHGNLEALRAVLADIGRLGISEIYCLGDIVGYGPEPEGCVNVIRERNIPSVRGNHEHALMDKKYLQGINSYAQVALAWTKEQLSDDNLDYLQNLPLIENIDPNIVIVHASLLNPAKFKYIDDMEDDSLHDMFKVMMDDKKHICFTGHTHTPYRYFFEGSVKTYDMLSEYIFYNIKKGTLYVIDVGSVGQPRDGNPKSSYCRYDPKGAVLRPCRVEYDAQKVKDAIIATGLPCGLGERLIIGK